MALLKLTPMLTVTAINPAVAFYRDVLGFSVVAQSGVWAAVALGSVEVMFALPNAHVPFSKPHLTGSLYFRTDNVDTLWAQLKDRCRVEYPLETFDYGMREFAVYDNSGYLLQFGQEVS
jgi:uncharacterized glyoxalase superfamily protein PhnB